MKNSDLCKNIGEWPYPELKPGHNVVTEERYICWNDHALELKPGMEIWLDGGGLPHRLDGPAYQDHVWSDKADYTDMWYSHGRFHRINGSAMYNHKHEDRSYGVYIFDEMVMMMYR